MKQKGLISLLPIWLQDRFEIRKAERSIRRLDQEYRETLAAIDRNKEPDKYGSERAIWDWERSGWEETISNIRDRRLLNQARKFGIEVPRSPLVGIDGEEDSTGFWEYTAPMDSWHLSFKAYAEIKRAIRKEKKERRDLWIPWMSLLVAALSALATLLAVILR